MHVKCILRAFENSETLNDKSGVILVYINLIHVAYLNKKTISNGFKSEQDFFHMNYSFKKGDLKVLNRRSF